MKKNSEFNEMGGLAESEGIPLYVRFAASLRTRIFQGEWNVGDRLPAFEELARSYGVGMNTVRKGVEVLTSQNLVSSARGLGTRITADSTPLAHPELRAAINDPLSRLSPEHSIAMLANNEVGSLCDELEEGYPLAGRYQHIHKVHSFRGVPYALVRGFVEKSEFKRFPKGSEYKQTLAYLLRDYGRIKIDSSRQELTIIHADQKTANLLKYPIAAPLVRLRHWRFDNKGAVIYASIVMYRSDVFVWDVTHSAKGTVHTRDHVIPRSRQGEASPPHKPKKRGSSAS